MKFLVSLTNLLSNSFLLGTGFGVPVYLHMTWIICFCLFTFLSPTLGLFWISAFSIVLAHEFGHVVAGKYFGCTVLDITLSPIGGAARMTIPEKPHQELVMALAGPFVNFVLIPPLMWVAETNSFFAAVNICNLTILIFNLIPAFPMDGGRVLRALLSRWSGNHLLATKLAVRVGQIFCVGFVIYGAFTANPGIVIIGFLMMITGKKELAQVETIAFIDEVIRTREEHVEAADAFFVEVRKYPELAEIVKNRLEIFEARAEQ